MTRLSLFVLSLLSASVNAAAGTCYYPDGKTIEPNHLPCNQTISAASACCDPLDSCSTSGFCLGRSGWIYRGSCTDQGWGSANCAKQFEQCLNSKSSKQYGAEARHSNEMADPETHAPENFWAAVWSCSPPGEEVKEFCCGYSSESCCNSSFTLGTTGVAFKPGFDALVQSISRAAVASATAGSTSSASANAAQATSSRIPEENCANSNGDLGTKVGVGVGVPLGVLAIGILTFLFWRESRNRKVGASSTRWPSMAQNGLAGAAGTTYHHNPSQTADISNGPSTPVATLTPNNSYWAAQPKANPWSPAPTYEAPANPLSPQELPNSPNAGR